PDDSAAVGTELAYLRLRRGVPGGNALAGILHLYRTNRRNLVPRAGECAAIRKEFLVRRNSDVRCQLRKTMSAVDCAGAALIELWRRFIDDEYRQQHSSSNSSARFVLTWHRVRRWILAVCRQPEQCCYLCVRHKLNISVGSGCGIPAGCIRAEHCRIGGFAVREAHDWTRLSRRQQELCLHCRTK